MKTSIILAVLTTLIVSCADYDLLDQNNTPDAVTLTVTGVQDSTVSLRWTQSNDENFKSYKFFCDTNPHPYKLVDSILIAQYTTETVRGLNPATRYFFSVIVTNQEAAASASNIATAVTWLTLVPQTQQLGDSSITLKWSPLQDYYSGAKHYEVRSDTTDNVDTSDALVAASAKTDSTVSVAGLSAGSATRFRVFVKNDSGIVTVSLIAKVNGWSFAFEKLTAANDTAVTLRWKSVRGADRYLVVYDTVKALDTTHAPVVPADTSPTIGNLVRKKTYWFRVFAHNAAGYFGWTKADSVAL
jgi:hypothetical protein